MSTTPRSLYIIDAIGPFFRGLEQRTINWSKIPWHHVKAQLSGEAAAAWQANLHAEFETFCQQAAAWGANAISIDDVTHLALHPWLEESAVELIERYRQLLRPSFAIAQRHGLAIYLTMDVFSSTQKVREKINDSSRLAFTFITEQLDQFLLDFPEISGVILRMGEADGKDVSDDFHSHLLLQNASETRQLLQQLLPVFEQHQKRLIFRTWTVGAYRIGDLMWNERTFKEVFRDITSPALVISLKHGDSDFFRYLSVNEHFFSSPLPKIVELQAKREYEGCGEYPAFIGWEHERILQELAQAENLIGCMVWCQTGGWTPFRRLALLDSSAIWLDLNTFVTLKIARYNNKTEEAVEAFAALRGIQDTTALMELLRLNHEVINELLYVSEFAKQKLYFRRVRIPPLLQVYWGNIFINDSVRKLLQHFVKDPDSIISAAHRCMDRMQDMKTLADQCDLPREDIEFMADTFQLLALAREYYFSPFNTDMEQRIRAAKTAYKQKYPKGSGQNQRHRYRIKTDFQPFYLKRRYLGWVISLLLRPHMGYRKIDHLLTLHVLSLIYRFIAHRRPNLIPKFAQKSAMGVETVFR